MVRRRKQFKARHGRTAPPPILTDFVYCGSAMEEATVMADQYIAQYFLSLLKH